MNDVAGRDPGRFRALDRMRGLVMILMLIDHASGVFNAGKFHSDQAYMGGLQAFAGVGAELDTAQFLTRWISHLCAPTFVFLAGTALALSVAKRASRGESGLAIDGHLAIRGLILIALEAWVGFCFGIGVLQVLYAIGASLICMTVLRRLPTRALWALGLFLIVGLEAVANVMIESGHLTKTTGEGTSVWGAMLFTSGFYGWEWVPGKWFFIFYPLLPWLGVMLLGWAFGRWLTGQTGRGANERIVRRLLIWGGIGLAVFVLQRAINDYGNYWLDRVDADPLRWLQVSKYPPSLAYCGLELGIMALCLAAFFRHGTALEATTRGPLLVFGQTALFFYLVHIGLLLLANYVATGVYPPASPDWHLIWTYMGTLIGALLIYPLCLAYRSYKTNHPGGWTRYL